MRRIGLGAVLCLAVFGCDDGDNIGGIDAEVDMNGTFGGAGGVGAGGVGGGAGGTGGVGGIGGIGGTGGGAGGVGGVGGGAGGVGGEAGMGGVGGVGGVGGMMGECAPGAVEACEDGCAGGARTCQPDGTWAECVGPDELCDAQDNDCDGAIDEDPVLGAARDCTNQQGDASVTVCENGAIFCVGDDEPYTTQETCDGLDEDLDGRIDEAEGGGELTQDCYTGADGTRGVGLCAGGRATCADGAFGACDGQVVPIDEICDGLDQDCDGRVDEGEGGPVAEACYDGPDGTADVGLCRTGSRVCVAGGLGACEGAVTPAMEICDQLDNDCDGAADEGLDCECADDETQDCYSGAAGTQGVGECRAGQQECINNQFGRCVGERLPSDEVCDGLDNDCDGDVDDGIDGVGDACTVGIGACARDGVRVCDGAAGVVRCDGEEGPRANEICDGIDNNCDGVTDEGLGLGDACTSGLGQCRREGQQVCGEDGAVVCDAAPGDRADEVCDGLDNDCDGNIDEDTGLGDACSAGVGACQVDGVQVCGEDGGVVCGAMPGEGGPEACDGADNDCDGNIDEDNAGGGGDCAADRPGACGRGTLRCTDGALICEPGEPEAETCDNIDNDCNGIVDDSNGVPLTQECYDGPEGTAGQGPCRGGRATCNAGQFGACQGQVLPVAEFCDTVDNDCNGEADDVDGGECACEPGEVRPCYGGPEGTEGVGPCVAGQQRCLPDGSGFEACVGDVIPAGEICDGQDNDCNGSIDDAPGVGDACQAGDGACQADGQRVCDAAAGRLVCNAIPGEPAAEICDGVDNNCNGVDDDVRGLGEACTAGVGACERAGNRVCGDGPELVCSAQAGQGGDEICNNVDDDCDGNIDEDFDLGSACTVGEGACQAEGRLICGRDGAAVCSARVGEPVPELCDGLDNDCDGSSDEGNPNGGGACETGVPGICARGRLSCEDGDLTCVQIQQPAEEICDNLDNDCDGAIDNNGDAGPLSQACYDGPRGTEDVGVCRGGRQTCQRGAFGACVGQVLPDREICDTLDNDCNGEADDVPDGACVCEAGEVRECYSGAPGTQNVGICRGGRQTCLEGGQGWSPCEGEVTPEAEICDGIDNNCDGRLDNAEGVGRVCSEGMGACERDGRTVCDVRTGQVVCNAVPGEPAQEICDGIDNNCNGINDDVRGLGDDCEAGDGECRRGGRLVCDLRANALVCDAVPGEGRPEICDDRDNDCDGSSDEGLGLGARCEEGIGACLNRGVVICNRQGGTTCSVQAGEPVPERCDAIDNDCDGSSDEGNPGGGGECATGLEGACGVGVRVCERGELACQQTVFPSEEQCDGQDNDCNGDVDDDGRGGPLRASCYDGPDGTAGVGPCREGTLTCLRGQFGNCQGQVLPQAERCDSLDNDCNGEVDDVPGGQCVCEPGEVRNCYDGPAGTAGVGICRAGRQACADDGQSWGACNGEVLPGAEVCDGEDNNCNGAVDDVRGAGTPCSAGTGECRNDGVLACDLRTGRLDCTAEPGEEAEEICDGLDNDCNGIDDDVEGLGEACSAGDGACRREGERICDLRSGRLICDARPGEPAEEICDDIDNDCDNTVDEGLGLGDRCFAGLGDCRRNGVQVCDGRGGVVCNARPGEPRAELCDGRDNNCDGEIDDGNPQGNQACETDQPGICSAGLTACEDAQLICVPRNEPRAEVCNNADDDCDGRTDESQRGSPITLSCYDGPRGTEGVGQCQSGTRTCRNGDFGACVGQVLPEAEVCDGVDNDCNNEVDDVAGGQCVCEPGEIRDCYDGPEGTAGVGFCRAGQQLCQGDGQGWGPCENQVLPREETCNGQDDNCSGAVDDVPGAGEACSEGQGECRANGVQECDLRTRQLACNAQPGEPRPEICDNRDNDCNGEIDDVDGVGDECTVGQGICARPGRRECDLRTGRLFCNGQAGEPRDETCNGLDDDCDGESDEGDLPGTGEGCTLGDGACEAAGQFVCQRGQIICNARPGEPRPEICDGIDNDCDRETDENPTDAGDRCTNGTGDCARTGVEICVRGALECNARPGEPRPEICDNRDNDCNGRIDDDGRNGPLVVACYDGAPATRNVGQCSDGQAICRAGDLGQCEGQVLPAFRETCDNIDNDCDRETDEAPVTGTGLRCSKGDGECQAFGVTLCRDGEIDCSAEPGQPRDEICDNLDNDCDQSTDEGGVCEGPDCEGGCEVLADCAATPEPDLCVGVDNRNRDAYFDLCLNQCADNPNVIELADPRQCRESLANAHQQSRPLSDLCNEGGGNANDCRGACQIITPCATNDEPEDLCPGLGPRDARQFQQFCEQTCQQDERVIEAANAGRCREIVNFLREISPGFRNVCDNAE